MRWLAGLVILCAGCGGGGDDDTTPITVHLDGALDADGEGQVTVTFDVDGTRDVIVDPAGDHLVEAWVGGADGTIVDGAASDPAWLPPRPIVGGDLTFTVAASGSVTLTVWSRGAPLPAVRRERSLTWTDPALLDDPTVIGLGRLMATISSDGQGGPMLDAWFRRFATTAYSERAGPAQLMDQVAAQQGADPSQWDLDALPFLVTAVHDRIDLAARNGDCGELRVSIASIDPVYAPFHAIFLFDQPVADDDVTPDGHVHCAGTARRWQRLSALDGDAWLAAAKAWLADHLRGDRFKMAETVELTVSPWEWRQW